MSDFIEGIAGEIIEVIIEFFCDIITGTKTGIFSLFVCLLLLVIYFLFYQ